MLLHSNDCRQHSKRAIMKCLGFACVAVLLGVSLAIATEQMQINYYSDNNCTKYEGDVVVTWAIDRHSRYPQYTCYNYNYGTSVNIANCYKDYCWCYFFPTTNCAKRGFASIADSSGNCLHDSSDVFYSFQCYYCIGCAPGVNL